LKTNARAYIEDTAIVKKTSRQPQSRTGQTRALAIIPGGITAAILLAIREGDTVTSSHHSHRCCQSSVALPSKMSYSLVVAVLDGQETWITNSGFRNLSITSMSLTLPRTP
jgi:hypothetical protein